jgi:hypothetical protein
MSQKISEISLMRSLPSITSPLPIIKNTKMKVLRTVLMQSVLLFCFFMYDLNASYVPPPDPEAPRSDDPDISCITDQQLKIIWDKTVIEYRRLKPNRSFYFDPQYASIPKSIDDQEYLITKFTDELHKESKDWNTIYTIIMVMSVGMNVDIRIPKMARFMLQLPRPSKMSDAHAMSYRRIFYVLGNQKSTESVNLLYEAVGRPFWGKEPMYTRLSKRNSEEAIYLCRSAALSALAERVSPEQSIPALRELAEKYPSLPEPEQSFDAEIGRKIQIYLTELLKKQRQNQDE